MQSTSFTNNITGQLVSRMKEATLDYGIYETLW